MSELHFTRTRIVSALQALGDELTRQTLDLLDRLYPSQEPAPKTRFFLEELFGPPR